jgi:DNA integrity scanning protein DisA with diadenylate cyclase activity
MPSVGFNVQIQPSTELEDMDGTFIVHDNTVVVAEGCIMPLSTATPIKLTQ